jgi:predicted nucleic acid-binding protein
MKLVLDLNILLDVVQKRAPFYFTSATVLSKILENEHAGYLPGHAVTTLYYLVQRYADKARADEVIDWLLVHFEIIPQDKVQFVRARALAMPDFEDAAFVTAAEAARCDLILTRNLSDFAGSPVAAMSPEEFLAQP